MPKNIIVKKNIPYTIHGFSLPVFLLFLVILVSTVLSVTKKLNDEGGYVSSGNSIHGDIYMNIEATGVNTAEITKEIVNGKMHIKIKEFDGSGNYFTEKNKIMEVSDHPEIWMLERLLQMNIENSPESEGLTDSKMDLKEPDIIPQEYRSIQTIQKTSANSHRIVSKDVVTDTMFVVTPNFDNGNIYVENNFKKLEMVIIPDIIAEYTIIKGDLDYIGHMYLKSSDDHDLEYAVEGSRKVNILGYELDVPKILYYDAQTGQKIEKNENIMDSMFFGFFKPDEDILPEESENIK